MSQPPGPHDAAAAAPPRSLDGCRVLLVEDHADSRQFMVRLLKGFGCAVSAASCVSEARAMADGAAEHFDLLICDIGLPDGDGTEVMRHVRARQPIRCVALSGFAQPGDADRATQAGFEVHLAKPVNFQTLEGVLRDLLSR